MERRRETERDGERWRGHGESWRDMERVEQSCGEMERDERRG